MKLHLFFIAIVSFLYTITALKTKAQANLGTEGWKEGFTIKKLTLIPINGQKQEYSNIKIKVQSLQSDIKPAQEMGDFDDAEINSQEFFEKGQTHWCWYFPEIQYTVFLPKNVFFDVKDNENMKCLPGIHIKNVSCERQVIDNSISFEGKDIQFKLIFKESLRDAFCQSFKKGISERSAENQRAFREYSNALIEGEKKILEFSKLTSTTPKNEGINRITDKSGNVDSNSIPNVYVADELKSPFEKITSIKDEAVRLSHLEYHLGNLEKEFTGYKLDNELNKEIEKYKEINNKIKKYNTSINQTKESAANINGKFYSDRDEMVEILNKLKKEAFEKKSIEKIEEGIKMLKDATVYTFNKDKFINLVNEIA